MLTDPGSSLRRRPAALVISMVVAAIVPAWIYFTATTTYMTWGVFPVIIGVIAVTYPVARHIAASEDDKSWLIWLLMLALLAKIVASLVRYYVAFEVYGGSADAARYFNEGSRFAANLREGEWLYEPRTRGGEGTEILRQITGLIVFVIGDTRLGAFVFFAWMSYVGLLLFYVGFRLAEPDADHRRYALLLFFVPTLVYWPSSIGKEAWMMLTLGLATYGAARLYRQRPGALLLIALGIVGSGMVRPHMSALLIVAIAVGFVLRRNERISLFGPIAKSITGIAVVGLSIFAVQLAEEQFQVEDGEGISGVERVIDETAVQTGDGGGSTFEATPATNPIHLPMAILTVMFRPLPFEAHNLQALVSSLEGVFLLGLMVASRRRFRQALRMMWRRPFIAFAFTYSLMFIIAFSSFGNFGLLARQRSQLFPLALVFFALPAYQSVRRRKRGPVLVPADEVVEPQPLPEKRDSAT